MAMSVQTHGHNNINPLAASVAGAFQGVSRQTVYNRAASARFPDWEIRTWREVK